MNFFQRRTQQAFKALATRVQPFLLSQVTPTSLFEGFSLPGQSHANVHTNWEHQLVERSAITEPITHAAIDFNAKSLMSAIVRVQGRDVDNPEQWNEIIDHPLERMLNSEAFLGYPSAWSKYFQAKSLMVHGEAYWMLVPNQLDNGKNSLGELVGMIPVPFWMMKPIPWERSMGGEPRRIGFFAYTPRSRGITEYLLPEEVCYHSLPNIADPIRGQSPLSSFVVQLQTAKEAEKYNLEDYVNGLTLNHIISLDPEMNITDYNKAKQDWYDSALEGSRFRIFRGGDVTVKELAQSRGETGIETFNQLIKLAALNFGQPEALLSKQATEASAKVAERTYNEKTLEPYWNLMAQDYTSQILKRYYPDELRAIYDNTKPLTLEQKIQQANEDRKTQTYDEARSVQNQEPHPNPLVGEAPANVAGAVYLTLIKESITPKEKPTEKLNVKEKDTFEDIKSLPISKVLKAVKFQKQAQGDIEIYQSELVNLIEQANAGNIKRDEFEEQWQELSEEILLLLMLAGSQLDELGEEEQEILDETIVLNNDAIPGLADAVYSGKFIPVDDGGNGNSIVDKAFLWANTAAAMYERSKTKRADNPFLKWRYEAGKLHCKTCSNLHGQVKTSSEWDVLAGQGIFPRSRDLDCKGWECGCGFMEVKGKGKK